MNLLSMALGHWKRCEESQSGKRVLPQARLLCRLLLVAEVRLDWEAATIFWLIFV